MLRWALVLVVAGLLLAWAFQGRLPSLQGRQPSTAITGTADTPLGQAVGRLNLQARHNAVLALHEARDAFAARVALMRAATRTLDIQYYIWHADTTGILLLDEVRRAADRGVRVRLLLDDNGIGGLDPDLAALDAHPQVEVRLFNPFLQRWFKPLGYVVDFTRLNRRMHNKSLTADGQATIVGGRNVGDVYFGADADVTFSDLDVLAAGPVAADVGAAFDAYWNSDSAFPLPTIVDPPSAKAAEASQSRADAARKSPSAASYMAAVQATPFVNDLLAGGLSFEHAVATLHYDPPAKAHGGLDAKELLATQLTQVLGRPRQAVDIVSPYFVPGTNGTEALAQLARQGIAVRIVTNSLAANDVAAVHAGYAKRRQDLLRAGVRLYEVSPSAAQPADKDLSLAQRWVGSSAVSLHGKTFAVDGERIFVGSFNLDPRSVNLNTEMGLIVHSPRVAGALKQGLDSGLDGTSYAVRLAADGELEWVQQTAAGALTLRSEPQASLARRLGVTVMSWLPIEWLL